MPKEMYSLMKLLPWVRQVKPGDPVAVRWTNCNRGHRAEATVVAVNRSSIRVKITNPTHAEGYPIGQEIVVPNFEGSLSAMKLWSWNNTILPLDETAILEQVDDNTAAEYSKRR